MRTYLDHRAGRMRQGAQRLRPNVWRRPASKGDPRVCKAVQRSSRVSVGSGRGPRGEDDVETGDERARCTSAGQRVNGMRAGEDARDAHRKTSTATPRQARGRSPNWAAASTSPCACSAERKSGPQSACRWADGVRADMNRHLK
jgi:hypothetical protein